MYIRQSAFVATALVGVRSHRWDFREHPAIEGITEQQVLASAAYMRAEQCTIRTE